MEKCECIRLMKGTTTIVQVDLTGFDMQGGSVVLTMSGPHGEVIKTFAFTEAGVHYIAFDDELTKSLMCGRYEYEYDIMWHLNGYRYAQCLPSPIIVTNTAGGCHNGN